MSKIEVNAIEPQSGTTLTLGASGDTVALAAGALQSGFGRSGSVNWDTTKKTANFTAVSGNGYFVDTNTTAITVTLPTTPSAGDIVAISDYANTFATNAITVGRNGSNIGGVASNAVLSTNGVSVTFVYVDATQGWIVTDSGNRSDLPLPTYISATGGTVLTCGDFKTHVFTGPGTFTVCSVGNSVGSNSVEYLVVAGGGGGGASRGGGGGAGGLRQNYPSPGSGGLPVTAQGYPITVGAGGGSASPGNCGFNGNPSIFSTITSTAGGGGASNSPTPSVAKTGGSGGGGMNQTATPGLGGAGNTPPVAPPQGNPGGTGFFIANMYGAGGGGGSSGAGGNGNGTNGGAAGTGSPIATTFFGPTAPSYGTPGPAPGRYFAGGGGGGGNCGTIAPGTAGGGNGGGPSPTQATAGTANTGGGGGGASGFSPANSGAGGSGIVVIRYKFQ